MANHNATSQVKAFIKEHGRYVQIPDSDWILFEDGALCEAGAMGIGLQEPPPEDEWECAKLVAQYHQIQAEAATEEFDQLYGYLNGTGVCPEGINTEEEQLAHLKKLRARARTAKAKYRKARKEVEELTPAWLVAKKRGEAHERKRKEQFLNKVNSIKL